MNRLIELWHALVERLEGVGAWLAPLFVRLLLAWEFFNAGTTKLNGSNWFANIRADFPFPFNVVPAGISWTMATWAEILFGLALLFGLLTRFAAFSLLILTFVAVAAVHWPAHWGSLAELGRGYAISNDGFGNYKLGLVYAVLLLTLIFRGPGKLSADALIASRLDASNVHPWADPTAWGLSGLMLGLPFALLEPAFGLMLIGSGITLLIFGHFVRR